MSWKIGEYARIMLNYAGVNVEYVRKTLNYAGQNVEYARNMLNYAGVNVEYARKMLNYAGVNVEYAEEMLTTFNLLRGDDVDLSKKAQTLVGATGSIIGDIPQQIAERSLSAKGIRVNLANVFHSRVYPNNFPLRNYNYNVSRV